MSTYSILNAGRIVAGPDSIEQIADIVKDYGASRVLIISDKGVARAGLIDRPKALLEAAGIAVSILDDTPPEPEVEQANAIVTAAKNSGCDMVVGIGGGSAMDVAKLTAVLLNNDVTLRELLDKAPIPRRGLPTLMIPTTAGTGSETTPNSIVLVPEDELKVGIVSPKLMPDCVILDPKMTLGLPPAITASTGMDALCHAIECYTSKKGNPFSEMIALKAISLITRSIRRAFKTGTDIDARHDMLLGAMYGGMCIATSSTTAVHALAYPLGGKYRIAHGVSNAILLPFVMRFNAVGNEDKFRDVAVAMGLDVDPADSKAATEKFIEAIFELNRDLQIPSDLKRWNITAADLETLVEGAAKVTRLLDNNPRPMGKADIRAIYTQLI
ncbi:MAG: iron-containing alcohol dehydrogenase [Propionivibrio sp.]|jgi:alcohol dehydrogenase class IV|uniref:iron-containing alcohol dehydrogenase n=1 Tax=Propionivibrio sp. TaxID=2212460 RepID=UPI001B74C1AC|nr:iron-containing alcohol dehydrogenase [Propionivibrio sp.]MBP7202328.1 iron-containing alcohol dehydrogenase [Propionivibrio sp.]